MAENQAKVKKLLIKSDVLWRALEIIKQFVSQNPPLPILDNAFFFNVSKKQIEIIGSDLVNFAKVTFPVQTSDEFCGLLQYDKLHKLLDPKLLPPQPLSIALDTETYVLEVNYQRGKTKSGSEECEDYPDLPKIEEKKHLGVVDAKNLREKIRKTPVSKNYEDYKNFVSEKHLQLIALPKNIDRKLPTKGIFSMFFSSDYLILEGFLENIYQTEFYFRRFQGLRENLEKEEIEAVKNSPKKEMMLLVEDVLEESKKIIPDRQKTQKKTSVDQIKDLVNFVLKNPDFNEQKIISYDIVDEKEAKEIKKATELEVLGFTRTLDNYTIKHILRRHGEKKELSGGQIPVEPKDFELIPDVLENPDKILKTKSSKINKLPCIAYIKQINGFIIVIEEVLESKKRRTKRLPIITMYKQAIGKGRLPDELMQSIVASLSTSETPPVQSAKKILAKNVPSENKTLFERIKDLKAILLLDKTDKKIKARIKDLELINAL